MNKLKNILFTAAIVAVTTLTIFPCGVPQPIYGRAATTSGFSIYRARIELRPVNSLRKGIVNFDDVQIARTSPFGWYRFEPVLPCSLYEIRITHKWLVFLPASMLVQPKDFPNAPEGVRVDFSAVWN